MDLPGLASGVFTATTIIATAFAGAQRARVVNLREANSDLRDRASDLEKERDDTRAERDKAEAEIRTKNADLEALGRVVTNEALLIAFGSQLEDHHEEAKHYWRTSTELSQQTLALLERLAAGGNNRAT